MIWVNIRDAGGTGVVLTEVLDIVRKVGIVEVGLYPNRVYQEVGEFDVEQEER